MQPYTCPCLRRLPCWYAALQHEPLVDGKLVHSVRRGSVANKEASSHLSPRRPAGMILPDSDDSEATCRSFRRFSLRVRLRPLTPLDQAIQQELAALAAAAATHRSACRWLDEWSGPEGVKERVAHRIEERHRREQEPHLLRLAELHQPRMATVVSIAAIEVAL